MDAPARGWVRLCLVLRSASRERSAGWWATREDWHFLELARALSAAADLAQSGYAVAVVETWACCCRDQYGAGWSMADSAWAPAARWAWRVGEEAVPVVGRVATPGNTLVHLLHRARLGSGYARADRRAWVTRALDTGKSRNTST